MNNKILWLVVAVLVLAGGGFLLLNNNASNQPTQTVDQTQNATPTQGVTEQTSDSTVTISASGFEPKTITVKSGAKVVWKNISGGPVTVNSDNHPTHLLWPFLNLGTFEDGSSVSVVFEKAGTYTYHNHLNSSQTGTVVVE
jgi:plastocyanin